MKIAVFWVVAPCSLVDVYQRFRGPCCLHHQGDEYLGRKFAALSEAKVKEGIFDGPQIRQFMKDTAFTDTMSDIELQAWNAFKDVLRSSSEM
jgi:hypothetical protein